MDTRLPQGECGKLVYPSKRAANEAKNQVRRKRGKREAARSYYCGKCGGWHLTSMSIDEFLEQGRIGRMGKKGRSGRDRGWMRQASEWE